MSEAYTLMHIPMRLVETVQGIASGTMVAVPREPSPDFWPFYSPPNAKSPPPGGATGRTIMFGLKVQGRQMARLNARSAAMASIIRARSGASRIW